MNRSAKMTWRTTSEGSPLPTGSFSSSRLPTLANRIRSGGRKRPGSGVVEQRDLFDWQRAESHDSVKSSLDNVNRADRMYQPISARGVQLMPAVGSIHLNPVQRGSRALPLRRNLPASGRRKAIDAWARGRARGKRDNVHLLHDEWE